MDSPHKKNLRAALDAYLASLRSEADAIRSRLREIDAELAEFGGLQERLGGGGVPPHRDDVSNWRLVELDTFDESHQVTAHDILRLARVIVSKAGSQGIRAIGVAKQIVPTYDPKTDDRKFENRVYSVLKHKEQDFAVSDGLWKLVGNVGSETPPENPQMSA